MLIKQIQPPAILSVSLADIKQWLKINIDDDNDLLTSLISSAQHYIEKKLNIYFIKQSFELTIGLDRWQNRIKIPLAPLISLDGFQFISNQLILTQDQITHEILDDNAETFLQLDIPPSLRENHNKLIMTISVGYGDHDTDVPDALRLAVKILASHYYSFRGDGQDQLKIDQNKWDYLIAPYMRLHI